MSQNLNLFEQNKYVFLENFLDVYCSQQYTEEFKKLIEQGQTKQDEQCPLSHSLGHTPLFDSLLEQLTPNIEAATGKKLLPTYAYARWYAPGDELKIHRDRESCEISATITLGFEGNTWPIYMGYDQNKQNCRQINMKVGDAVVYKGCEMYHWREKYVEGNWQAQVFIHYVDANGPNAIWKYDKREKLAHHPNDVVEDSNFFHLVSNCFSDFSCNKIIEHFESYDRNPAGIGTDNILDEKIRKVDKVQASPNKGVGASLTGVGLNCNNAFWKFDITNSDQAEFLRYDSSGHYTPHVDTLFSKSDGSFQYQRKLTVLLFLNDDFEGGKFFLQLSGEKIYPKQRKGDVVIFPSFLLHGVEPVIKGVRRSVVTWLVGPNFK